MKEFGRALMICSAISVLLFPGDETDAKSRDQKYEEGGIYSVPHIERRQSDNGYTDPVFASCPYEGTITNMTLALWKWTRSQWVLQEGIPPTQATPEEIMERLFTWNGRYTWDTKLNYDSPNPLGIPADLQHVAKINFILAYNAQFDRPNDSIDINLLISDSTNEGYVMAQLTSATVSDSHGNHSGDHHLCAMHAIPKEYIDEAISWFIPAQ